MKRIATVYDMMISSPNDTKKEVEAVFESVMEFNNPAKEKDDNVMVRIVRWNTDVFMNSNKLPQTSINEQIVSTCDFAVVIFKHRLGTPVGDDESGTTQEIRLLRESNKQIFVFWADYDNENDNLKNDEQYSKLQAYINKLKSNSITVFRYKNEYDLKNQVLRQLSMYDLLRDVPNLQKANDLGICTIATGGADNQKLDKILENAKHIKIFHTTGLSFFHSHIDSLAKMLRNNGTLQILLSNPYSDFLDDVNRVEERGDKNCISEEFSKTMDNIRKIWQKANYPYCDTVGKIKIGCAHTLLRQSEIICIDKENEDDDDDKHIWCWVTMTMPPRRAVGPSVSLECCTSKSKDGSLAAWTNSNFNNCWNKSKYIIDYNGEDIEYFYMEKHHAEKFWRDKLELAKESVHKAQNDSNRNGILIEVASQHPLKSDGTPGDEFISRLDFGYEIYKLKKAANIHCRIYVPGSLHMENQVKDKFSLSEAGKTYLIKKGVPLEDIYDETQNIKYRGNDGVYNSADECYVASKIWEDEGFAELFCVCSPFQSMRKVARYIAFGVFPFVFTCPSSTMFHDYVSEMFTELPYVLYKDPCLDPQKSELAIKRRQERNPNFADINSNKAENDI